MALLAPLITLIILAEAALASVSEVKIDGMEVVAVESIEVRSVTIEVTVIVSVAIEIMASITLVDSDAEAESESEEMI